MIHTTSGTSARVQSFPNPPDSFFYRITKNQISPVILFYRDLSMVVWRVVFAGAGKTSSANDLGIRVAR